MKRAKPATAVNFQRANPSFMANAHQRKCLCRAIIAILFIISGLTIQAQPSKLPLHGEWSFALDPVKVGEKQKWHFAPEYRSWDKVTVPHSFSADQRYLRYTGTAWYVKKFGPVRKLPAHRSFIRFEAVYYKASVWMNGQKIGDHEGGYTPFVLDVTEALSDTANILAVKVDNAWDTTSIPGAKTQMDGAIAVNGQLFPWINYGGITREVYLITRPDVFVEKTRIEADPDLGKLTAQLRLSLDIHNKSTRSVTPAVSINIYSDNGKIPVKFISKRVSIPAGSDSLLVYEGVMSKKDLHLWSTDDPFLYTCEVALGADTVRTHFGVRKIEIRDSKLLLNGEAIRMGGCNRVLDHPQSSSLDPPEIIEEDLTLIKNAGMELSRLSHYPVSSHILDWADRNGLLIIGEPGNWQLTPQQMADPAMRAKFRDQLREMVERDWNHPSVIAWSIGNEYRSYTPEGQAWTKDMKAYTKTLDPIRPVTFATRFVWHDFVTKPEHEASQYADFICANIYGNHLAILSKIHKLYPDKPILVSEFGKRADHVESEQERVDYVRKAVADFRKCDYVIGAAVWTFNDYKSMFPGTNINGYRPFGLVTPEREKRAMYHAVQEEFSPAIVSLVGFEGDALKLKIEARADFPSYTLRGYVLRCGNQAVKIKTLRPGESEIITLRTLHMESEVSVVKPGGFVILTRTFKR